MTDDRSDLQRFVDAQDAGRTYDAAVEELRRGRKTSHWMWFVFPQVAGLGSSSMAERYAIRGLDEAQAYLTHPVLGPRLVACAEIVAASAEARPEDIFGGIDTLKLRSSMTLFREAAPDNDVFQRVLDRYFEGAPDARTLQILGRSG